MKEIWKEVKGSNGKYKVSNIGKVWSNVNNMQIGVNPDKNGYHSVNIIYKGERTTIGVHRLVGFHFLDNYEDGDEINHKDANKSNNRIDNLEWGTHQHNMTHVKENGLHKNSKKCCRLNKNKDKILEKFNTIGCANKKYETRIENVRGCCIGTHNDTGGLVFRFYDEDRNTWTKTKFDKNGFKWNSSRRQKIKCIETDEVFESQMDASRELNIKQTGISNYLNGKRNSSVKGYTFKRID